MDGLSPSFYAYVLGSYVLGSVPTGLWLGYAWKGVDVRRQGSGNLGATNVFRVLGTAPGVITLVIDILKGFIPVLLTPHWFPYPSWAPLVVGIATIVGHTMSIFVRFRGGKGVATSAGVFAALLPMSCLVAASVFAVVFAFTRIVSISSITGAMGLALSSFWLTRHPERIAAACAVALFFLWTHRANMKRLRNGTEPVLTRAGSKAL